MAAMADRAGRQGPSTRTVSTRRRPCYLPRPGRQIARRASVGRSHRCARPRVWGALRRRPRRRAPPVTGFPLFSINTARKITTEHEQLDRDLELAVGAPTTPLRLEITTTAAGLRSGRWRRPWAISVGTVLAEWSNVGAAKRRKRESKAPRALTSAARPRSTGRHRQRGTIDAVPPPRPRVVHPADRPGSRPPISLTSITTVSRHTADGLAPLGAQARAGRPGCLCRDRHTCWWVLSRLRLAHRRAIRDRVAPRDVGRSPHLDSLCVRAAGGTAGRLGPVPIEQGTTGSLALGRIARLLTTSGSGPRRA
jgi:hypothetical protein